MQIHLKMGQAISLSWMACFWPLVAGTVFTTIPSVLLLARNEQATVVPVLYHRIVARKTIYDAVLRLFFLALVMAKVGGTAGHLEMRLITLPVWAQLLVLLVMLHTSVKSLNDPACARDFKKRSVLIELHLLASLFIAMKIDGNITWTWVGVFWPLVSSRHSRSTRSESACLRACSFCAFTSGVHALVSYVCSSSRRFVANLHAWTNAWTNAWMSACAHQLAPPACLHRLSDIESAENLDLLPLHYPATLNLNPKP